MTKRPENVLYELQKTVATKFFAKNPIKKFPEDFLTKETHADEIATLNVYRLRLRDSLRQSFYG